MGGSESPADSPGSPAASTNIHTSNEYMELDEPEILDEKKALLEEFERKRRARMIHVTTDDSEVRALKLLIPFLGLFCLTCERIPLTLTLSLSFH